MRKKPQVVHTEEEQEQPISKRTARALWTGTISFGLVTVPVRLYPAVRERSIRFHLLDRKEKVRLRRKLVRTTDDTEVPTEEQVRGYEVAPDQYVVISEEELQSVQPHSGRAIDIQGFVKLGQIDPVYYQKPYYLAPGENGAKAYRLLLEAMTKAGRVGIGTFILHDKEYLVALRPLDDVICLETMHYSDEVVAVDTLEVPRDVQVQDREMKIAVQLIEAMSGEFTPREYHDTYREAVEQMVKAKVEGKQVITQPAVEEAPGEIIDLLSKLEASLAEKKKQARKVS